MLKVKNNKCISRLADKSFRANKTRNIIAVIAIALTLSLIHISIRIRKTVKFISLREIPPADLPRKREAVPHRLSFL